MSAGLPLSRAGMRNFFTYKLTTISGDVLFSCCFEIVSECDED